LAATNLKCFTAAKLTPGESRKPVNYLIAFFNKLDGQHAGRVKNNYDDDISSGGGGELKPGELRSAAAAVTAAAALPTLYMSDEGAGVNSGAFNFNKTGGGGGQVGTGVDSLDALTVVLQSSTDDDNNVKVSQSLSLSFFLSFDGVIVKNVVCQSALLINQQDRVKFFFFPHLFLGRQNCNRVDSSFIATSEQTMSYNN
jgi:hypothetical protein